MKTHFRGAKGDNKGCLRLLRRLSGQLCDARFGFAGPDIDEFDGRLCEVGEQILGVLDRQAVQLDDHVAKLQRDRGCRSSTSLGPLGTRRK
jgi:hypothetical protein